MIKKVILVTFIFFSFLLFSNPVLADLESNPNGGSWSTVPFSEHVFGKVNPPDPVKNLGFGAAGISNILSKIIQLIYIVASLLFVFMVIISAVQWIISGGDKEAVSNARKRLTWALIGIVFLALAFVIITVVGQITGFVFFAGQ